MDEEKKYFGQILYRELQTFQREEATEMTSLELFVIAFCKREKEEPGNIKYFS